MKERGILFSGPMVLVILDDRKGQTRRTRGLEGLNDSRLNVEGRPGFIQDAFDGYWQVGINGSPYNFRCPYGVPGDRLWVREGFRVLSFPETDSFQAEYVADGTIGGEPISFVEDGKRREQAGRFCDGKNHPSIHMPRWASRLLLEVKDIRVERLQEITEEDAKAEGCNRAADDPEDAAEESSYPEDGYFSPCSYISGFAALWDSLNKRRGFPRNSNPWVWVVVFRRIEP